MNNNETHFLFLATRQESLSKEKRDSVVAAVPSSQIANCISRCLAATFSQMALHSPQIWKELMVPPATLKEQGAQFDLNNSLLQPISEP